MARKSTKNTKEETQNSTNAFQVKLTEDQLAACIAKEMSMEQICAKFDVKPGTVRSKFAKLMAKEKGLDDFFVESRGPRYPKVQKNQKVTKKKTSGTGIVPEV